MERSGEGGARSKELEARSWGLLVEVLGMGSQGARRSERSNPVGFGDGWGAL